MGKKAMMATIGLNAFSSMVWISILFLENWVEKEWHIPSSSLWGGGLTTYGGLLWLHYDFRESNCNGISAIKKGEDDDENGFEDNDDGKKNYLQRIWCTVVDRESVGTRVYWPRLSDAYCEDTARTMISEGCYGTMFCRIMGIMVFMGILGILAAQGLSSALIYYYFTSSPKKKYRVYAQAMLIIAPICMLLLLFMYLYAAISYADMWKNGRLGVVLGTRNMSWFPVGGCWVTALFNTLLMFAIPFIVNVLKTKNERLLREARMQKEFEQEMARYAHEYDGAEAPYGGQYDAYGGVRPPAYPASGGGYPASGGGYPAGGGGYPGSGYPGSGGYPGY